MNRRSFLNPLPWLGALFGGSAILAAKPQSAPLPAVIKVKELVWEKQTEHPSFRGAPCRWVCKPMKGHRFFIFPHSSGAYDLICDTCYVAAYSDINLAKLDAQTEWEKMIRGTLV